LQHSRGEIARQGSVKQAFTGLFTGIAITREEDRNKPAAVLCLYELEHRGNQISLGEGRTLLRLLPRC
jgi:hypothetical protein